MSESKNEMDRILNSPNKGIEKTRGIGGILARLWRQILLDVNMKGNRFEYLLNVYIAKARYGTGQGTVVKHITRGNLRREMEQPAITWKSLIRGLKILPISHLRLQVHLTWPLGKVTSHEISVDLGDQETFDDIDDAEAPVSNTLVHNAIASASKQVDMFGDELVKAQNTAFKAIEQEPSDPKQGV